MCKLFFIIFYLVQMRYFIVPFILFPENLIAVTAVSIPYCQHSSMIFILTNHFVNAPWRLQNDIHCLSNPSYKMYQSQKTLSVLFSKLF